MTSPTLFDAVHWLRNADGLLITAGAGIGVDSGLPDFRGDAGLWQHYPVLGERKLSFAEIANPLAFDDDAKLAWGFYGHRLRLYRETMPHRGFAILQSIAATMPHGAFVFTSNVDGQFQKAGFDETRIVECHGSIHHLQCTRDCGAPLWAATPFEPEIDLLACRMLSPLPLCPNCGALARPNIMMFDDWSWQSERSDRQAERYRQWRGQFQRLVVIELGAGVAIPTVRQFSERSQAPLIRINPLHADAPASATAFPIKQGALDGLTMLGNALADEITEASPTADT
ncbi:SIR2 family NAD-dependent protein deacylase [Jeongeupia chitinilytica]|uniref:protein acetyllysine N-acetyltransferase n=1 Tax=Jeongeupia chitinilytica TaxID=1041641 RepID=A0ABQ3GY64_9NEIS|nr:Sir2 family NAD-dependent protein deacetylase [Jeongeupia chitinilytica]GHD56993.1 hypothetical protein GCM10007350_05010 [Jeongeupia chitinilytica]